MQLVVLTRHKKNPEDLRPRGLLTTIQGFTWHHDVNSMISKLPYKVEFMLRSKADGGL
jgi:hypothetical protein